MLVGGLINSLHTDCEDHWSHALLLHLQVYKPIEAVGGHTFCMTSSTRHDHHVAFTALIVSKMLHLQPLFSFEMGVCTYNF